MRRMMTIACVVGVLGALAALVRFGPGTTGTARTGSPLAELSPAAPSGDAAEEAALERLRTELRRAPRVQRRSDAERLADARAWVAANRPHDWPYADHEARTLAFWDSVADGEKRSARWLLENARLEMNAIRSLDADGDGLVTDAEAEAFVAYSNEFLNVREHPYLRQRLDTNADGVVSSDELMLLAGAEASMNTLGGVLERVQIDRWDADGDGLLDDDERAAGLASLHQRLRIDERGSVDLAEEQDPSAPARNEASLAGLASQHGGEYSESIRRQAIFLAFQRLSSEFLMSASLVDWFASPPSEELRPPVMPNPSDFSEDGSNRLVGERLDALMRAMEEYERDFARYSALVGTRRLQAQFATAVRESDLDGDGRLRPDEWERRTRQLVEARDERLFLMHYDLDRNGRVEPHELEAFLRWYRAGSLRADANFDGVVDASDLEEMIRNVERQKHR